MPNKNMLDSVKIPIPCNEKWENMIGDSRKRFCLGCQKDVYNLSSMSQREAVKFAAKNEGKVCIRYSKLSDGSLLTTGFPLHQISPRRVAIAAGVIAASASLSIVSYGQNKSIPSQPINNIVKKDDKGSLKQSQISFTIEDRTKAVVPDAKVVLTNKNTHKETVTLSNQDGIAQFFLLERGSYDISVSCCGFDEYHNVVQIKEAVEPNIKITLQVLSGAMGDFIFDWSDIPLFRAIAQADNETVKKALNDGFNVNTKDSYGNTALTVAADHCNLEIVRLLIEKGANVNVKDNNKLTPVLMIFRCAEENEKASLEIFKLLVSRGADVNVRDEDNETLLMRACEDDSVEGVKLLLEAGADPNLKDDGKTAYEMTDSDEIRALLIKHGAHPVSIPKK